MRLVNLILSQNQINPCDRTHMCICACVPQWVCMLALCIQYVLAKSLNPWSVCLSKKKKIQSLQTLPMDATSHEEAKHMDTESASWTGTDTHTHTDPHAHTLTLISNQDWRKMNTCDHVTGRDLITKIATAFLLTNSNLTYIYSS